MDLVHQQQATQAARSGAWTAFKIVSGLTVALVLVQAILAGRGWFVNHDFIDIHGVVAEVVLLVVLAQAGLAFAAASRGLAGRGTVVLDLAILVLVFAQLALGYAGKTSGTAASLHVPNGVLIFGLTVTNLVLAVAPRRAAGVRGRE